MNGWMDWKWTKDPNKMGFDHYHPLNYEELNLKQKPTVSKKNKAQKHILHFICRNFFFFFK